MEPGYVPPLLSPGYRTWVPTPLGFLLTSGGDQLRPPRTNTDTDGWPLKHVQGGVHSTGMLRFEQICIFRFLFNDYSEFPFDVPIQNDLNSFESFVSDFAVADPGFSWEGSQLPKWVC